MKKYLLGYGIVLNRLMILTMIFQFFFFSSNNLKATDIHTPGTPYSIICIDFDLDGDVDIVVGCNSYEGDTIAIYLNDGLGNFDAIFHPEINNLFYTQCADMNGDNFPDIIAINDDLEYGYYINIGNGLIGEWYYIFDFTGEMVTEVYDFDNNGFNDLLYLQNLNPGKWGIVYNYGDNSFTNEIQYSSSENLTSVCSGYLDEDTLRDVLIVSPDPSLGSQVFYNNGNSFIQSNESLPRSSQGFIADINNDNINDIALNHISSNSFLQLIEITSTGFIILDTVELPDQSAIRGFPDLNNDNFPDIFHRTALPSIGFDEIYVSFNNFNWGFLTPHNYSIGDPSMPITQDYSDLNGDGYIDLLLANYMPGRLMKLLWNDGFGYFILNNPVNVHENKFEFISEIIVYPNPGSKCINIEVLADADQISELRIYNSLGRLYYGVEKIPFTDNTSIVKVDNSKFPVGIYYYQLMLDNQFAKSGKIVKQ